MSRECKESRPSVSKGEAKTLYPPVKGKESLRREEKREERGYRSLAHWRVTEQALPCSQYGESDPCCPSQPHTFDPCACHAAG